jgi:flavodoxin
MFGNTAEVAAAVARGLALEGVEVTWSDVRAEPGRAAPEVDLLVVGAPTHAFGLPRPVSREDAVRQGAPEESAAPGVREWLEGLPRRRNDGSRLAATFDTRVTKVRHLPRSAATGAARRLAHLGYTIVEKPAAFLVEDVQGDLLDGELEKATAWGRKVAIDSQNRLAGASLVRSGHPRTTQKEG